jgi:hypothetical protein
LLKTQIRPIEEIPNDVTIDGDLTVTGTINGGESGGDEGVQLPEGEFEGAVLGWRDDQLTWLAPSQILLPDGVFGPIASWDSVNNVIEVVGAIPPEAMSGAVLYQCTLGGAVVTPGWNHDLVWSAYGSGWSSGYPLSWAFNSSTSRGARAAGDNAYSSWKPPEPLYFDELKITTGVSGQTKPDACRYKLVGQGYTGFSAGGDEWKDVIQGPGYLEEIGVSNYEQGGFMSGGELRGVMIDGRLLVDPVESLSFTVQSVDGQLITGTPNMSAGFIPGYYLKLAQTSRRHRLPVRVSTTDIDLLRST